MRPPSHSSQQVGSGIRVPETSVGGEGPDPGTGILTGGPQTEENEIDTEIKEGPDGRPCVLHFRYLT